MKYILIITISFFIFFNLGPKNTFALNQSPKNISGEIIVKLKKESNLNAIKNFTQVQGGIFFEPIFKKTKKSKELYFKNLENIYKIKYDINQDTNAVLEKYRKTPEVIWAEPNRLNKFMEAPDDPKYLDNTQWHLPKISASAAWDIQHGNASQSVAIIDTGVDWNHPDLDANIWTNSTDTWSNPNDPNSGDGVDNDGNGYIDDYKGWDFVHIDQPGSFPPAPGEDGFTRDNNPMDFHGHGTFTAGIASAVTNNAVGIAGATWNSKIMPVRAGYDDTYSQGYAEDDDLAAAILYAADNGATVISMSWGGISSEVIKSAINYAYYSGSVLVAAAGNDDWVRPYTLYPAYYNKVIGVAATNSGDAMASFSNWGSWVDISAPGQSIYSTAYNNTYGTGSGTSASTPLVAGVAALLRSKNPTWGVERIKKRLINRTDYIDNLNYNYRGWLGSGRLNGQKTLLSDYTHPDGVLIKTTSSSSVYWLQGQRHWIPNISIFNARGFNFNRVALISPSEMSSYAIGSDIGYPDGVLIKGSGSSIYLVENGSKRHITSMSVFNNFGFNWSNVRTISDSALSRYSTGDPLYSAIFTSGSLLKTSSSPNIYFVEDGERKLIPTWDIFTAQFESSRIITVSQATLDSFDDNGARVLFPDGSLIKGTASTVYLIEYGAKRRIVSASTYENLGFSWSAIKTVSDESLTWYPDGDDIT